MATTLQYSFLRPHTASVSCLCFFSFWLTLQEALGKCDAKVCCLFKIYIKSVFHSFEKARIHRTTKMVNWQLSNISQEFNKSITDMSRHTKHLILTLSLALGWQSKQLDCHSTVFHPNNPLCPTPGPLSACTSTALLSPCGGPASLQSALCWSSSWVTNSYSPAEQDHTCQSKGNTCWRVAMARVATCGLDQGSHWIRLYVLTLKHKDKSRTCIYAYSLCLKRETMFGRCAKEDSQIFVKRKKL